MAPKLLTDSELDTLSLNPADEEVLEPKADARGRTPLQQTEKQQHPEGDSASQLNTLPAGVFQVSGNTSRFFKGI